MTPATEGRNSGGSATAPVSGAAGSRPPATQDEADYSDAVLATFDRFKQGAVKDYEILYRTEPGMNHIAAEILELVARLFPEEFAALDEYCRQHAGFLDEGHSARRPGTPVLPGIP